ncbi:proteasome assembly chaperone family protein [Thermococci archaeon]|nr:MAG: proteasome assembly chaperone family protein [Thermococci archaeon]
MKTEIVELEKINLKNPILIEGLPGIGLIGKIAVEYLISELKTKKFAELYSPHFPHQAIIEKDSSLRLVRDEFYYYKGEKDLIILTGDTQVHPADSYGHYEVVQKILDFSEKYDVKEIYTLGGYSSGGKEVKEPRVLASGTDQEIIKRVSSIDSKLIFREDIGAAIVGASGLLLAIGRLRNFRGLCLLGESSGFVIDPKAAKSVLHCLNKILGIDISLEGLEKKIKENEELIKKLQKFQEKTIKKETLEEKNRGMEYIR